MDPRFALGLLLEESGKAVDAVGMWGHHPPGSAELRAGQKVSAPLLTVLRGGIPLPRTRRARGKGRGRVKPWKASARQRARRPSGYRRPTGASGGSCPRPHGAPSLALGARHGWSSLLPPVYAKQGPVDQLDVLAVPTPSRTYVVVYGDRCRAATRKDPAAAAATVARHQSPPAPCPPHRRAETHLVQQRMPAISTRRTRQPGTP